MTMVLVTLIDFDGNRVAVNADQIQRVQQGDVEPRSKFCTIVMSNGTSFRVRGLLADVVDEIDTAMQGVVGRKISTWRTQTIDPSSTDHVTDAIDVRAVGLGKASVVCSDFDGATIALQWSIDGVLWSAFSTAVQWTADAVNDVDLTQVRFVRWAVTAAGTAPTRARLTLFGDLF